METDMNWKVWPEVAHDLTEMCKPLKKCMPKFTAKSVEQKKEQ